MLVNKNKLLRCRRRDRMLRSFYMHTFIRLFINVTFSFPSQTCLMEIKLCFVWSVCVYGGLWWCITNTVCYNIASSLLFHIDTQFFEM